MPTDEQRKAIEEVLADRQEAIAAALIEEAETLVPVAVQSTLGELRRRTADKFTRQIVAGIAKEQVAAYRAQVAKGGTDIIERVVTALGDGRVSITTRRTFKPWLSDMATRDQEGILRIISDGSATACIRTRSPANSGATSTARSTTPSPQLGRRRRRSGPTPGSRPT